MSRESTWAATAQSVLGASGRLRFDFMRIEPKWLRTDGGVTRCWWCGDDPDYVRYHDEEWGWPERDDVRLFEKICLEGFQSGLSWLTILRKRENFRRAFAGFAPAMVARFDRAHIDRLLGDAGIVRHRGKIEAAIENARRALDLEKREGRLADFVWSFAADVEPFPGVVSKTTASEGLSRALKTRGWRFVGPTTMYAVMQSVGIVNDHVPGCHRREPAARERRRALEEAGRSVTRR